MFRLDRNVSKAYCSSMPIHTLQNKSKRTAALWLSVVIAVAWRGSALARLCNLDLSRVTQACTLFLKSQRVQESMSTPSLHTPFTGGDMPPLTFVSQCLIMLVTSSNKFPALPQCYREGVACLSKLSTNSNFSVAGEKSGSNTSVRWK